jgi:hypothetical protein
VTVPVWVVVLVFVVVTVTVDETPAERPETVIGNVDPDTVPAEIEPPPPTAICEGVKVVVET